MTAARQSSRRAAKRGAEPHFGLSAERLLKMYRDMALTRRLTDRMMALQRQGRVAFFISGQGQEAAQVGTAHAIKRGVDWVFPYYRDQGVCISLGMTPRELLLDLYGKVEGPCSHGRQMPSHFGHAGLRIVSGSSPVATQTLHAVGCALASVRRGQKEVSITYLGEGSTGQGDFHEAMNFAGIHRLPVIFVVENNGYAISQPQWKEMAVQNVADRAQGYGFRGSVVDGNDVMAVYQTTNWAIEEARRGQGPALIECKTYRIVPHSSSDDDRRYRTRKEVEEWTKKDPIDRFRTYLMDEGLLTEEADEQVRSSVDEEVADAVRYAEQAADPDVGEALKHVYAQQPVGFP
ncbi:MAG: thiamine pyrophosphate-dependent dehydrogenase E1 component subunit alpha [Dehalococcoidia bacterium]